MANLNGGLSFLKQHLEDRENLNRKCEQLSDDPTVGRPPKNIVIVGLHQMYLFSQSQQVQLYIGEEL